MTKRLNSSEANFEPQHKMHISEKEISYGQVPNSIYDKTLKLLFNGARNLKSNKGSSLTDVAMKQPVSIGSQTTLKQMCINSHYRLDAERENKVCSENTHHCHLVTSIENMMKCCFCEKSICEECTITCSRCKLEYCKICSMCIYSADFDYLCLGCYE